MRYWVQTLGYALCTIRKYARDLLKYAQDFIFDPFLQFFSFDYLDAVPKNPGTVLRIVWISVGTICRGTTVCTYIQAVPIEMVLSQFVRHSLTGHVIAQAANYLVTMQMHFYRLMCCL